MFLLMEMIPSVFHDLHWKQDRPVWLGLLLLLVVVSRLCWSLRPLDYHPLLLVLLLLLLLPVCGHTTRPSSDCFNIVEPKRRPCRVRRLTPPMASRGKRSTHGLQQQLVDACKRCDSKRIRSLMQTGYHVLDVNQLDSDGYPPLVYCVVNDSPACIDALSSESSLDFNTKDAVGDTCLHHGVAQGSAVALKHLLTLGASPNATNALGNTPLHTAVLHAKVEFVAMLIRDKRLYIDGKNHNGLTALALAVSENQEAICRLLLRGGANPLEPCGVEQYTPIHLAAALGHLQPLTLLTGDWVKVPCSHVRDRLGRTPLHVAVIEGRKQIIEALLQEGCDPLTQDAAGLDALEHAINQDRPETLKLLMSKLADAASGKHALLHVAAQAGRTTCLKYLLDNQVPATKTDHNGNLPLQVAIAHEQFPAVEMLVTPSKTVLDNLNREGYNALHLAIMAKDQRTFQLLLLHGADPTIPTNNSITPAALAIQNDNALAFEILAARAEQTLDLPDTHGRTCLHHACDHPHLTSIVPKLLAAGVDRDRADDKGMTPLLLAARANNIDAVRALLQADADVKASSPEGMTALHFAATLPDPTMCSLLLETACPMNQLSKAHKTCLDVAYGAVSPHCARLLLLHGARIGEMRRHQAAQMIKSCWRSFYCLRRQQQLASTSMDEAHVLLMYTLRCQLSAIRRYFFQQAWSHHQQIMRQWVASGIAPAELLEEIFVVSGASRVSTATPRASSSGHLFNSIKHSKHKETTSIGLPPISPKGTLRRQFNTAQSLSLVTSRAAEERVLSKLKNKLSSQDQELLQLKQENQLLKTINKNQEQLLVKVHGVDTRLEAPSDAPTLPNDGQFGSAPAALKPPSTKLNLELKRQQTLIRKFKQRFEKLQTVLSQGEEAATPLPRRAVDVDPDMLARRAHQKLLRKQMQNALEEIVKLRSDTESLSKLLHRTTSLSTKSRKPSTHRN
eukprot:m.52990 g.52990  ORF g.52990 m.52990 type:complete len:962 (+) comp12746_c1_seq1:146-3031(+)